MRLPRRRRPPPPSRFVAYANEVERLLYERYRLTPGEAAVAVQNYGAIVQNRLEEDKSADSTAREIAEHGYDRDRRRWRRRR